MVQRTQVLLDFFIEISKSPGNIVLEMWIAALMEGLNYGV